MGSNTQLDVGKFVLLEYSKLVLQQTREFVRLRSRLFAVTAPRLWNSIPTALRQPSTAARFLSGLTKYVSSTSS